MPQNFTNNGQMPINGGHAKSGNGDSTYNNNTRFGGTVYNKGMPQWVLYVGLALAAYWVLSGGKS
ncbi:hypothetical protein [Pseudoalteromonas sp. Of7M-16]|uniref:hypothetical protein n=1 Tax=Pseudoalteromonas sp. Of7M-16 TaxID=2917756 RepID=UPI001EF6A720|nr:hypothetical protein [Pseudoalteromonas sp. Of7M-16]MCG7546958.1 hypothetical protein [Pseudoalteromonas sp. Of7M-16]